MAAEMPGRSFVKTGDCWYLCAKKRRQNGSGNQSVTALAIFEEVDAEQGSGISRLLAPRAVERAMSTLHCARGFALRDGKRETAKAARQTQQHIGLNLVIGTCGNTAAAARQRGITNAIQIACIARTATLAADPCAPCALRNQRRCWCKP